MEYEIKDEGQDALFDDSTNPSLRHEEVPREAERRPVTRADTRKLQKAELIPEEEQQLA